jgi:hypothetical protein
MTTYALRAGMLAATLALAALVPAGATTILFDSHASITTSQFGTKPVGGTATGAALLSNDYTFAYAASGIAFGKAGSSAGSVVVSGVGSGPSVPGSKAACGLDVGGNVSALCTGDQYFYFTTPDQLRKAASTSGLSFELGDSFGVRALSWIVHLYDVNNVELEARAVSTSGKYTTVSFTEVGINRVCIENTSPVSAVGAYFLDTINFTTPVLATRVPEPASLGLFGLGLAALLARRTRRRNCRTQRA